MEVTTRNTGGSRGKGINIYMKPETESKAKKYCKQENITLSLLIKMAIDSFLERMENE